MSATTTVRWVEGGRLVSAGIDRLDGLDPGTPVWVDVTDPDRETLGSLAERYKLHPLAVEDCLHRPQRPKLDQYADSLFMIWVTPRLKPDDGIEYGEVDIFLGNTFLITSHQGPQPVLEEVAGSGEPVLDRGVEWALHAILDRAVDDVFPAIDNVAEQLDEIEDLLMESSDRGLLQRLYGMKRILIALHRTIGPERDSLRVMTRHEMFVSEEAYMYFQDVGDHLARLADSVDTYRDVASGAMDIYLSAVNNRMNQIMKTLTVVATIFMPLTLISGIYGMNLTPGMWPPSNAVWSFAGVIAMMLALSLVMIWLFRRRDWW